MDSSSAKPERKKKQASNSAASSSRQQPAFRGVRKAPAPSAEEDALSSALFRKRDFMEAIQHVDVPESTSEKKRSKPSTIKAEKKTKRESENAKLAKEESESAIEDDMVARVSAIEANIMAKKDSHENVQSTPDHLAWLDEDDELLAPSSSKPSRVHHHEKSFGIAQWAQESNRDAEESQQTSSSSESVAAEIKRVLTRSSGFIDDGITSRRLAKGILPYSKISDIHFSASSKHQTLTSLQFHPTGLLFAIAIGGHMLQLRSTFEPQKAPLYSVLFEGLPSKVEVVFSPSGHELFIVGDKSKFYVYNLNSATLQSIYFRHERISSKNGDSVVSKVWISPDGQILLFGTKSGRQLSMYSAESKQLIGDVPVNGSVSALCFSPDSKSILVGAAFGRIYHYNVENRRCVHEFQDEGTTVVSALAMSPDGRYIASGSPSGVVNIYDAAYALTTSSSLAGSRSKKPLRSLMHLVTGIRQVVFSPDSQMLMTSADTVPKACRIYHIPSFEAFSNFPEHLVAGAPSTVAMSPANGVFAIATREHNFHIYQLSSKSFALE